MSYAHPGSIQVEVGGILQAIRFNIEQGDIVGIAKFCRLLKGTVSVYADDEPALWQQIMDVPAFAWDKDEDEAFEDEMERRELCLRILRKQNIFGYVGAPPLGNSDALLQAMKESDLEEEAEA
jgi:hypothetical protein